MTALPPGESARRQRAMALFDALLDLELPARERATWLQRECGGDMQLRQRVEALLAADATAGEPFSGNASHWSAALAESHAAGDANALVGHAIGPWRISGVLGHGGMGAVYRAERADGAYRQDAALKLIRVGLDTPGARDRFLQERQILARLQHPRIARLLDGGLSATGAPYFAMELVEGQRIDAWCDVHRRDVRQRVELVLQVLDAVAYAHRNLVVHRDLKPSNVLVDGEGEVRLLDFGIAKLLDEGAGDPADATRTADRMLTPEYASPEQLHGEAITTGTDLYQLGVLLYALLAGTHPFGLTSDTPLHKRMGTLDREPETLPRAAAGIADDKAAARRATPASLARLLRGDLEAIVGRCLEKDPARRYPGVAGLADDLRAWLQGKPVAARVPGAGYRFLRFAHRNRLAVGAVAAVILSLACGLVATTWQARRATLERNQVLAEMGRTESIKNYLTLMFRTAGESQGNETLTAKQVLDQSAQHLARQYRDQPKVHADILETVGSLYLYMNDYDGVAPLLRDYLGSTASKGATPGQRADIGVLLAEAELRRGDTTQARHWLDDAQATWNADPDRYRKPLVASRQLQAQVEKEESGLPRSIATLQLALQEHDGYFGRDNTETANVLNSLGNAYQANGDIGLADDAFRDSWNVYRKTGNQRSPGALLLLGNWATVAYRKQDYARAESLLSRAVALRRELYGPSAALAAMQANLGKIVLRSGRPRDALAQLEPALAMAIRYTGEQSPLTFAALLSLAEAQGQLHDFDSAERALAQACAATPADAGGPGAAQTHPGESPATDALCLGGKARLRLKQGRIPEARELARQMTGTLDRLGDVGTPYRPDLQKLQQELRAAAGT